jgi:hypothetical protein
VAQEGESATTDPLRGEWTSASNALADRLCRGRHQAQINLPELPCTDLSEAGTVIHAVWTGTEPPREPGAEEMEKAQALSGHKGRALEADLDVLLAGCVQTTSSAPTIERVK